MKSRSRSFHSFSFWAGAGACFAALALVVGSLAAAPDPAPQIGEPPAAPSVKAGEDECPVSESLACGQFLAGELSAEDCTDDQNRALDVFTFFGQAGQTITATLTPGSFVGDLEIYDPSFEDYAEMEGGFASQPVQVQTTLNQTSDLWRVVVKTDDAGELGTYQLSLDCSGDNPPPPGEGGFFTDPQYPDFEFRVRITAAGSTVTGVREPDCIDETVCVSGNLPGRSEVFLRVIGPRPNGFLWPTIVRFTPSRVDVDFRQISTGQTKSYTLAAVPPSDENLSGRQDRTGFLP